jgi:endonuclease/exonuclease/phosphatase family metal-dependent hydrolase
MTGFMTGRSAVRRSLVGVVIAALAILTVPTPAASGPPPHAQRRFNVMTYNVYLGADFAPLFAAPPGLPLVAAAAAVYAQMVRTDFPSRADAIAFQIDEHDPELIGLQEVALWQTGPLADPSQLQPSFDFLAILLDALEDRGLHYRPVATNSNFSGTLPISATTLASFLDRDVILARSDLRPSKLRASNASSHTFQAALPLAIGGQPILVPRGWSTVDIKYRGKSYRFANTHLEAFSVQVRNLQAQELAASLASSPLPVVLAGDLNSLPTDTAGAYGTMLRAGFVDAWVEAMGGVPGFTAGQSAELTNVPSAIDHTVDYVMHNRDGFVDALPGSGDVVGEELDDRTPSGLWPSDHAGVEVDLRIARP